MATGGRETSDLNDGQEEVFDWTCHLCEEKAKVSKAVAFCQDCNKGYCGSCLEIHRMFPSMRNHVVHNEDNISKWGECKDAPESALQCPEHSGQILSMYCKEHNAVCCPVCVALDHKLCRGAAYIPTIAKGIKQSDYFRKTLRDLGSAVSDIDTASEQLEVVLTLLDDSKRDAVEVIEHAVGEIQDILEGLGTKAKSDLDDLHKATEDETRSDLSKCLDVRNELEVFKQKLDVGDNFSEQTLFVTTKMAEKKISESKVVIQSLSDLKAKAVNLNPDSALKTVREIRAATNKGGLYKLQHEYSCNVKSQKR